MCGVLGARIVAARLCKPGSTRRSVHPAALPSHCFFHRRLHSRCSRCNRCLLTLKTKHFMFHIDLSFDFLIDYLRIV